jgi:hypothetical protein
MLYGAGLKPTQPLLISNWLCGYPVTIYNTRVRGVLSSTTIFNW